MPESSPDGTVKLTITPSDPTAPAAVDVTAPQTSVVSAAQAVEVSDMVKKPAFLERVVARGDLKRRDVKPAVEAALAELADALLRGEALHLPPLGKLKVVKDKTLTDGAHALTLKLRTMKDAPGDEG